MPDVARSVLALFFFFFANQQAQDVQGLQGTIRSGSRPLQPAPDIDDARPWIGRDIFQNGEPQRRHRVPGAVDGQRQRPQPRHADCQGTAHDLGQLFSKSGRHFRRMCIDNVTVGSDIAYPIAVIDLAQHRQHLCADFAIGADDGRKVFDRENAVVADLAQQAASSRPGAAFARRC